MNTIEQFRKQRCFCRHHAQYNQIIATVWFHLIKKEAMAMTGSKYLKKYLLKSPTAWLCYLLKAGMDICKIWSDPREYFLENWVLESSRDMEIYIRDLMN